jgi:hypothetical protein
MRERERLTWVAGLAIDVPISAPTSKAQGNSIHEQVKKQQWSCYVSPNRLRHSLSTSPFLLASILISSSPQKQIPALYRDSLHHSYISFLQLHSKLLAVASFELPCQGFSREAK